MSSEPEPVPDSNPHLVEYQTPGYVFASPTPEAVLELPSQKRRDDRVVSWPHSRKNSLQDYFAKDSQEVVEGFEQEKHTESNILELRVDYTGAGSK